MHRLRLPQVARSRVAQAFALTAPLWATGCIATDPPGEQVGIFDVQSTLIDNSCGPEAVIAGNTEFAIELRQDGVSAYWQLLGGQPMVGEYQAPGSLEIQLRTPINLYGSEGPGREPTLDEPEDFFDLIPEAQENAQPGCVLIQSEVLKSRFGEALRADAGPDAGLGDGGAPDASTDAGPDASDEEASEGADAEVPPDLEGTHELQLAPSSGSDCTEALLAAGGPFVTLPCEVHYELTAYRRSSDE